MSVHIPSIAPFTNMADAPYFGNLPKARSQEVRRRGERRSALPRRGVAPQQAWIVLIQDLATTKMSEGLAAPVEREVKGYILSEVEPSRADVGARLGEIAARLKGGSVAGDAEARADLAEELVRAVLRGEREAKQLVVSVLADAEAHYKNREDVAGALSHYHVPLWAEAREALETCLGSEYKYLFLSALQALLRDRWETVDQELERLPIPEGRRLLAQNLKRVLSEARR